MERQLLDEKSTFWDEHFMGMARERQASLFTHVLSVVFVRGAFLFGLTGASNHGRCILDNNVEVRCTYVGMRLREVCVWGGIHDHACHSHQTTDLASLQSRDGALRVFAGPGSHSVNKRARGVARFSEQIPGLAMRASRNW